MTSEEAQQKLQHHNIRPTSNRILILQALDRQSGPVSQKQLEYDLMSVDKSGVSRSLALLHQHGLVHQIPGPVGVDLWELCHSHEGACSNDEPCDDEHAHFYCTSCGRTWCLHDVETPHPALPPGFHAQHCHFVITGLCARCSEKNLIK